MPIDPGEPIEWPDDFDPLTIPAVMPVTVRRTTSEGYPTQFMLDWEQGLQGWMKKNQVDLNTKLTKIYAETEYAYAAVTTETNARITEDEALAEQITTVEAAFGTFSAYGEIYFAAKATPTGASASYGVYLTAGSSFGGLEIMAISGGGSAIGLTANQIKFTDSGTAQDVFYYSGGKFQFYGNVAIDGSLTINGTIYTDAVASQAITQNVIAGSSGNTASVTITIRPGGSGVAIIATFNGAAGYYVPISTYLGTVTVDRDASYINGSVSANFEASGSGGSAGVALLQTTVLCSDYPGAGTYTYTVTTDNAAGVGGVTIQVQELAR